MYITDSVMYPTQTGDLIVVLCHANMFNTVYALY